MVYLTSLIAASLAATVSVSGLPLSARQAKPFTLQNGKDAQSLNAKFATLTKGSSCTAGDNACIDGGFAQCVNGSFVQVGCAGGLSCFALPLVNKAGTSIACTTQADAEARISATGATGGVTGGNNVKDVPVPAPAPAPAPAPSPPTSAPPAAPPADAKPFTLQNGKDAQALNAKFATLSDSSLCQDGDQACINGGFAQCVGGKFAITQCAGGTKCFALPLVNKAGTSITCSTDADAEARIAATGATGGITGGANPPPANPPPAADNDDGVVEDDSDSEIVGDDTETPAPAPPATSAPAPAPPANAKPFTLQNGKDAQALNAKFATLNAGSSCTDGEQACINDGFAQCIGGKFAITQCAGGTKCFALPLVNKAGTSITCSTDADAAARIAATGATGGIQG